MSEDNQNMNNEPSDNENSGKTSYSEFMSNYNPKIDYDLEDDSQGDGVGAVVEAEVESGGFDFFGLSENKVAPLGDDSAGTSEAGLTASFNVPDDFEAELDVGDVSTMSDDEFMKNKIKKAVSEMPPLNKTKKGRTKKNRYKGRVSGPIRGAIYLIFVFGISTFLAIYIVLGSLDLTGLGQSTDPVTLSFTSEQVADLDVISKVLKDNGVIKRQELFKVYAKLKDRNEKFVAQNNSEFFASMGYESIVNTLLSSPREAVTLTFPEGLTAEDMAKILEKNNVCKRSDFIAALNKEYPYYSFLNEMPKSDKYDGRVYNLEGFLFPDTYDFYIDSKGETIVKIFLDNFNEKVSTSLRAEMKTKDMNLYDVITQASIVEWEAGTAKDMPRVARVLSNRAKSDDLKKLQCDSTYRYLREMKTVLGNDAIKDADYDTYEIEGLPVSPINNPGLDAIKAVVNPTTEDKYVNCFYFVTNIHEESKPTYFSETFKQHDALCKRYKIGIYNTKK